MLVSERQDDSNDHWQPRRIAAFLGIGMLLYLMLFGASEGLVRRGGDQNPFFRIMTSTADQDWLILGASHAMPLGFGDSEDRIEAATGQRILNLSATGIGPFVWRIAAERFFRDHQAKHVLVVVDAFAFRDRSWNEDRLGDTDFMPHIPWDSRTLAILFRAVLHGLPVRTFADYATGFSKIGNPDRFQRDIWEGAAKFERSARPSAAADRARITYLYPGANDSQAVDIAFARLAALVDLARMNGATVTLLRPPLPDRFRALLPGETEFFDRLRTFAASHDVAFVDMAAALPDPQFYFDPDHLNRSGVAAWLDAGLRDLLIGDDRHQ